jgi:pimeloyl-ACP methyl ester carboxylesterase
VSSTRQLDAEQTSRFVHAEGLRVHLHEAGEGPTLVLLHGGGPGGGGWSNFKQNLPALSAHFRVLIIDQPGYGKTDKPDFSEPYYTLSARVVRAVLDELGVDQAHFVGNSLGGGTSLRLALDYPDRVGRMVLMGPGGGSTSIFTPEPAEGIKALVGFYDGEGPTRARMENIIRLMTYDHSFVTDELIEERYQAALEPGAQEGAMRALRSISRTDDPDGSQLWRHFATIPHKTLLVWGRDDRTVPLDGAFYALKRMPDARLHVFPRCGHWAQLEHRAAFDRLTIDFLTCD